MDSSGRFDYEKDAVSNPGRFGCLVLDTGLGTRFFHMELAR